MAHRIFWKSAAAAALTVSFISLHAQSPGEPTAYTVTMRYHITGTALRTTYRLGSKVLVDQTPSSGIPPAASSKTATRTLYFLVTGRSLSWEPANSTAGCTRGSFVGDEWLDPFAGSADLAIPDAKPLGTEVVHGMLAKIVVSKTRPAFKLWIEPKTGLILKAEFTPPSSDKAITYSELTEVHLGPPPAALFEVPAYCGADLQVPKGRPGNN
jgi:hypothetical protein